VNITSIFRSKTRKALFRIYFSKPEEAYYLRELERKLDIPVALVRRELMRLAEEGIFRVENKGNLCYYSLNRDYPLFNELKSIVFKTIGIQGALQELLRSVAGVEIAFIYGSFARDEARADSDVDVFIVGGPDQDMLVEKVGMLEEKLGREINYTVYSRADIKKKKKERNPFLSEVLSNPTIPLLGSSDDV
jgi:predicted nucleotidyltransferase